MKRFLIVATFVIGYTNINAQSHEADSLLQLLQTTQQDTSKCLLLVNLSRAYVFNDPDSAMLLVQQGLMLAKKEKFQRGEAICLIGKGSI